MRTVIFFSQHKSLDLCFYGEKHENFHIFFYLKKRMYVSFISKKRREKK